MLAAVFAASVNGAGASISAEVSGTFDRMIPAALDSYARSGADADSVARMRQAFEAAREFARECLWGIFGVALGARGGGRLLPRSPDGPARCDRRRGPVRELLRVPPRGGGVFRRRGGGIRAASRGGTHRLAGNLLLPLLALFFVAGLSIICHFFRRWFRVRILRVGLYALAAYFPINVGVALLGLFDWYVDFRRRGEGVAREIMKVILADDVRGLGHRGDTVTVKPGYARNYLFPQGVAYEATDANVRRLAEEKRKYDEKMLREKGVAAEAATKVEGLTRRRSRRRRARRGTSTAR